MWPLRFWMAHLRRSLWSNLKVLKWKEKSIWFVGAQEEFIQSLRCWNTAPDNQLKEMAFTQSQNDPCIYYKHTGWGVFYIAVYMDNIILAGKTEGILNKFKESLLRKFDQSCWWWQLCRPGEISICHWKSNVSLCEYTTRHILYHKQFSTIFIKTHKGALDSPKTSPTLSERDSETWGSSTLRVDLTPLLAILMQTGLETLIVESQHPAISFLISGGAILEESETKMCHTLNRRSGICCNGQCCPKVSLVETASNRTY